MFGKILGKKQNNDENKELIEKISKMNLTDMRAYIKGNIKGFEPTKEGLIEILKRLTTKNEETQKYYLHEDDMDSKKKKAFDIVLIIAASKKINAKIIELIEKFYEIHKKMIHDYDARNAQIYGTKFKEAINIAIDNLNKLNEVKEKMKVLDQ